MLAKLIAGCYYSNMKPQRAVSASSRPPTLLALPSYVAGNVAYLGNRTLVARLKEHGLGLAQYAVLVALLDFGASPPHELATRLQTDRSHISAYVEASVKRGWVIRVPDTADRRRVTVELTPEGRDLVDELAAWAAEAQRDFLSALTETEQETLRLLLLRILEAGEASNAQDCETD
jgi:MarR family transcriptional regulator, lower aerobic nicotinate degradation pathway regulator